ncbi:hypothetical protein QR680_000265 [Steinernema hermaphroditum]|uniref:Uncharacterized protein n=1 Tax=Steinernema hermaphroditum TaxID=289476 RepID=A0AA39LDW0_9BILA|nr:hypothetical protein QR680_000265 [Steinernema hermaphroditum]
MLSSIFKNATIKTSRKPKKTVGPLAPSELFMRLNSQARNVEKGSTEFFSIFLSSNSNISFMFFNYAQPSAEKITTQRVSTILDTKV